MHKSALRIGSSRKAGVSRFSLSLSQGSCVLHLLSFLFWRRHGMGLNWIALQALGSCACTASGCGSDDSHAALNVLGGNSSSLLFVMMRAEKLFQQQHQRCQASIIYHSELNCLCSSIGSWPACLPLPVPAQLRRSNEDFYLISSTSSQPIRRRRRRRRASPSLGPSPILISRPDRRPREVTHASDNA